MEADYFSLKRLVLELHLPPIAQAAFRVLAQPEVDLLVPSHTNQCQHYNALETFRSVSYSSSCFSSISSVEVASQTYDRLIQMLNSGSWMKPLGYQLLYA